MVLQSQGCGLHAPQRPSCSGDPVPQDLSHAVLLLTRDLNKMSVSAGVDQESWRPLLAAMEF